LKAKEIQNPNPVKLGIMIRVILSTLFLPFFSFGQPTSIDYFREGKNNYENGYLMSAVETLTKSIELDSTFSSAYYYRGCALNKGFASDGMDTITKDFLKCIALAPDSAYPEAYYYLADLIIRNNDSLELKYYNKAIEFNPTDYRYFRERGHKFADLGRYEEAFADYTKAIALNKLDDISYRNKSQLEWNLGRYKEAIQDFEMEAHLVGYMDYWDYATLLCQAGESKKAEVALNKYNAVTKSANTLSDLYCNRKSRK
jgi:tetratricopeptide (TPR) repeat protein